MNIRIFLASLVALSLGWSGSALAKDDGFYVGAGVGTASFEATASRLKFDEDDFAWKIFGGYQFNGLFAIEGGYVDFGAPDDSYLVNGQNLKAEVDPYGIDAFAVIGIPIGPIRAFGKLGGVYWNYDVDVSSTNNSNTNISFDEDGFDLAAGLGLEVELFGLGVRAEAEYFDIEDDVFMYSLGATFTF